MDTRGTDTFNCCNKKLFFWRERERERERRIFDLEAKSFHGAECFLWS